LLLSFLSLLVSSEVLREECSAEGAEGEEIGEEEEERESFSLFKRDLQLNEGNILSISL
jgi:hypothetical protein